MSITHGGTAYLSGTTHQLPELQPWVNEPMRSHVYGVRGSLELTDERHGRPFRILCTLTGYATWALLEAALLTLEGYVPAKADKTLVVVVGASTLTYYHCTFDGVERLPNPANGLNTAYYDGSGVNGWRHEIALHFWQLDHVQ